MDGTFLRSDRDYDRERFARVYAAMRRAGARLVIASGNQYEQLAGYFPGLADELGFVADNGAYVLDGPHVLEIGRLGAENCARIVSALTAHPDIEFVASGSQGAYVLDTTSEEFFEKISFYFPRIARVPDLGPHLGELFKFSLDAPTTFEEVMATLARDFAGVVVPVTSGHKNIDLIAPGAHKGRGLEMLMRRWGLDPSQCAAFGDGGNDIEMLQLCAHSYAMAGSPAPVRAAARHEAGSNDDSGVLRVLEQWFGGAAAAGPGFPQAAPTPPSPA